MAMFTKFKIGDKVIATEVIDDNESVTKIPGIIGATKMSRAGVIYYDVFYRDMNGRLIDGAEYSNWNIRESKLKLFSTKMIKLKEKMLK